ncbi:MAG: hypothetical protein BWK75_01500 [Candidatus Altiarchaeales archaeon A3]|nr:MAG: hypothetical protein BWK75_01500 [Candidatus Altiarchaeales archaeon A3]
MHTKRISAGFGKYPKKLSTPRGPHKKDESFPLTYVIRDMLKFADNSRETDKILREGNVLVDGRMIKDGNFGIGIMDVLSFPKINKHYRLVPSTIKSRNLLLKETSEEEAKFKLAKVTEKHIVKGNKIQISTEDGYSFLINKNDDNAKINTKDTIVFDISSKKKAIKEILKFKEGAIALIIKGRNKGKEGKIVNITEGTKNIPSSTKVGDIETSTEYVLVIGEETPLIQITSLTPQP